MHWMGVSWGEAVELMGMDCNRGAHDKMCRRVFTVGVESMSWGCRGDIMGRVSMGGRVAWNGGTDRIMG